MKTLQMKSAAMTVALVMSVGAASAQTTTPDARANADAAVAPAESSMVQTAPAANDPTFAPTMTAPIDHEDDFDFGWLGLLGLAGLLGLRRKNDSVRTPLAGPGVR